MEGVMDDKEGGFGKDPFGTLSRAALMKKSSHGGDSLAATCRRALCGTSMGRMLTSIKNEGKGAFQRVGN